MSRVGPVVVRETFPFPNAVLRVEDDFGILAADVVSPPRRFWADSQPPVALVEPDLDTNRLTTLPTPAELLNEFPDSEAWANHTRRSVNRVRAHFLICEDPQRRLDAREVRTLAHQVSLVQHILEQPSLNRVLVADEVGLGKTVEAGLLVQRLLDTERARRVLYLAPARLVTNVRRELNRLGLAFRQWTATDADARLTDPLVVASIHKAAFGLNAQRLLSHGPWDVLIVDECHHLSDWAAGGGDATENFRLVRELIKQQGTDGRVVFLSGTPHQGHRARFENLIALLRQEGESTSALAGRVIYRTKEDVRDWDGRPLFPRRQVNPALVFDPGVEHRSWIGAIHDFYAPSDGGSEPRRRAMGWRCAQALQWAASSPQAGLGYLVRQAIRAGWRMKDGSLSDALLTLRPYRNGAVDEPVGQLYQRVCDEVDRQAQVGDVEDIEEESSEGGGLDADERQGLDGLLRQGIAVVRSAGDAKWAFLRDRVLAPAGQDKVVLFAQPIETVLALRGYLATTLGEEPALVIGGQSDAERREQIARFWHPDGPRILVSSRAGGEGINLQVARRIVHVDVPWNPMELEQRVGRVHRFGSRDTIVVDTLVVKDSREEDAYRVAREKLRQIVGMLVEPERIDVMFDRVMSLIQPEDLQNVLIQEGTGPLSPDAQEELAILVQHGYRTWCDFHSRFADEAKRITDQEPGVAQWADVADLLVEHAGAQRVGGFEAVSFIDRGHSIEAVSTPADVLRLKDGAIGVCGDYGSSPVLGPNGQTALPLGLNNPAVADLLRRLAFPEPWAGAAQLRWPEAYATPVAALPFGLVVLLRQTVRAEQGLWLEQRTSIHVMVVPSAGDPQELCGTERVACLRAMFEAVPRVKPAEGSGLEQKLVEVERQFLIALKRRGQSETDQRVRHAVVPLLAAVVSPR